MSLVLVLNSYVPVSTSRLCSPWPSSPRKSPPNQPLQSLGRSWTSCASAADALGPGYAAWRRPWGPPLVFTTRTSQYPRRVPKPNTAVPLNFSTTRPKASPVSRPRQEHLSGEAPYPSRQRSTGLSARSTWSGHRTSRNPIAGS